MEIWPDSVLANITATNLNPNGGATASSSPSENEKKTILNLKKLIPLSPA
jgi:hypothetical protein